MGNLFPWEQVLSSVCFIQKTIKEERNYENKKKKEQGSFVLITSSCAFVL
jgi:hypothetical protein